MSNSKIFNYDRQNEAVNLENKLKHREKITVHMWKNSTIFWKQMTKQCIQRISYDWENLEDTHQGNALKTPDFDLII